MPNAPALVIEPAVRAALNDGAPVVALETAVLTHGLPRPRNFEVVQRMQNAVRAAGATSAVIGVLDGRVHVGADDGQLAELATRESAVKLSARDLAWAIASGASGGTTVAGTLAVCEQVGIRVFATGGIGGVHQGWERSLDVSADLAELARARCCTVSAGAKSVLDLRATLEALETQGVAVVGWRTDHFPQFHSRGCAALPVPRRLDSLAAVARLCRARWDTLAQGGVLLANPIPEEHALGQDELDAAVADATRAAERAGITGAAVTPFLLAELERVTAGRSVAANLELLVHNAALAGALAVTLASRE